MPDNFGVRPPQWYQPGSLNPPQQFQPSGYPSQPMPQFQTMNMSGGGGGAIGGAANGAAGGAFAGPIGSIVGGGLGFLGGMLGGNAQAEAQRRQLAEQQREFDISGGRNFELGSRQQQQNEGSQANDLQRQMAMAPLRDQIVSQLHNRMGMSPQQFVPRDMFNPQNGPQQNGGVDLNALSRQNAAYQPGQGGQMDTSVQQAILHMLGYDRGKTGANGQPGPYQHTQPTGFNSAQTTNAATVAQWEPIPGAPGTAIYHSHPDANGTGLRRNRVTGEIRMVNLSTGQPVGQ